MLTSKQLEEVNNILKNDGVIAFVTDTVWGIGCLPSSKTAVEKIYSIKHRDAHKPLILMSNEVYHLLDYLKQPLTKTAHIVIKKYFPGAVTVVAEKSENTGDYLTSGMNTVGVRVPDNALFAQICEYIDGHVLATTSANISNEPAALTYEETLNSIGDKVDLVLPDCGCEAKGTASTVVGITDDEIKVFRQGAEIIEI